jgi:hypothetical protein
MSRRAQLGFGAACLLAFALIAALVTWGPPSTEPSGKTPATVTLAPGPALWPVCPAAYVRTPTSWTRGVRAGRALARGRRSAAGGRPGR